jgi:hypothetical protein
MMTSIGLLFAAGLLILVLLCSICIWAPRRAFIKVCALITAALYVPLGYASLSELLSMPKPVSLEWWRSKTSEATVLASSIREGKGIYLWLQLTSAEEPRAYVLPWNRELAEDLQKAMREAESAESGVGVRLPFEPSLDNREPKFYALPQPAMPPKDMTNPPPTHYKQPGADA